MALIHKYCICGEAKAKQRPFCTPCTEGLPISVIMRFDRALRLWSEAEKQGQLSIRRRMARAVKKHATK